MNQQVEIELEGQKYRVGKLAPLAAFHVMRRVMPLMHSLGLGLGQVQEMAGAQLTEADFVRGFQPVMEALAKMPDADVNYVISACLGVVYRLDGERWAPVQNGGSLMYQDITMPTMVKLTMAVCKENLGGFFGDLLVAGPV